MERFAIVVISFLTLFTSPGCRSVNGNPADNNNATSGTENLVNSGVQVVYRMTNVFLSDILQSKLLTSFPAEYTASTEELKTSLVDNWQTWAVHYIGYIVCAAIGIVGFFIMLLAALFFPCCRCCGRCGVKDPELLKKKRKSRCCIRMCELSMVIVTISLIVANLSMYAVNEESYPQLKTGLFDDVTRSLSTIDELIEAIPVGINHVVYVQFLQFEAQLLQTLDNIPAASMAAINDATGVVASLEELSTFTGNLPALETTMSDAIQLAVALDQNTTTLWTDYTTINSSMATKLTGCSSESCQNISVLMPAAQVTVNFTVISETLTPKQQVISQAIQNGFVDMVNGSVNQLTDVNNTVIQTMGGTTRNVKEKSEEAKNEIRNAMDDLRDTLEDVDIAGINETIVSYKDKLQRPADYAHYAVLAISAVVSLIIISNIVGVLLGLVLPPLRRLPSTKKHKGECCRKSVASHFLMLSVALTFLFYWLYIMLVLILFLVGGLMETELCRHMVNYDNDQSAGVLSVYDSWINQSLNFGGDLDALPFHIYNECSHGATVYKALNMEKLWNVAELTNTEDLSKSITDLKETGISILPVNLTNDDLKTTLIALDIAFNPVMLNITKHITDVSGPVIVPDFREIRDAADSATNTPGGVDLSAEVTALNNLINTDLIAIETTRNALIDKLTNIKKYIGNINFTSTSLTLDSAQQELNINGSEIVGKFINDTGDAIYGSVVQFSTSVVYAIENTVAVCTPLSDTISDLIDSVCVRTLYPVNSFWFSLGWCLAFLVPSLIMAVKLATIYRYTQITDGIGPSKHKTRRNETESYL